MRMHWQVRNQGANHPQAEYMQWFHAPEHIAIGTKNRDIELRYTGLNFRDPENLHFRYRLDVYDDEWQLAGPRRSAFYTNLPPRQYRFNVVAHDLKYKADLVRDYTATPPIECLPFQLNQVFLNLLINAVQAINYHGVITIATRSDADELRISFSDTGEGIAPEHLPRIFDPFSTTKPVGQGTGLGLAIYVLRDPADGHIEVKSELGIGTAFTLHLPLRRAAASA